MLKDITLGQYFPGNSIIHRLDPRTKLIMLVVYIVALFMAKSWISYGLMLAFLLIVIRISTIPAKSIVKGMKPLVMLLAFTGILNLFFTQEGKVLVDFWVITITTGGILRAIFMVSRILMLICKIWCTISVFCILKKIFSLLQVPDHKCIRILKA